MPYLNSNAFTLSNSTKQQMLALRPPAFRWPTLSPKWLLLLCFAVFFLQACTQDSPPTQPPSKSPDIEVIKPFDYDIPNPTASQINMRNSRWVPAAWNELLGWDQDQIAEAWQAWLASCKLENTTWKRACQEIDMLSHASENQKRQWMFDHLQPYRVESLEGAKTGLLTAYYEPVFRAQRKPSGLFQYPLYYPPSDLKENRAYWSRKAIESHPKAIQALKGYELAYLADPLDVLILHIQGSGQLILTEEDGQVNLVRAAYAATNNRPYKSVGRYLLDRKLITDATWPGIKAWLDKNPKRLNEVLWSNPRYVFFKEQPIDDITQGPLGAQGVPLSYGRSIAVDKTSIPYGTPVWIASEDPAQAAPAIQKLVVAQDTGSAITGAVRADYFWGKGPDAGEQAGRTKQTLQMWVFLPRGITPEAANP